MVFTTYKITRLEKTGKVDIIKGHLHDCVLLILTSYLSAAMTVCILTSFRYLSRMPFMSVAFALKADFLALELLP